MTLVADPQIASDEPGVFNVLTYQSLDEEGRKKVEHIYNLSCILQVHGIPPIQPDDFDTLYDMPSFNLEKYVGWTNVTLNNIDGE